MRVLFTLILLAGCRGFVPNDGTDDTSETDDTSDTDTDTDTESGCPDPAASLDATLCDGAVIPAASAYYVGDFDVAGGEVTGREYEYLFANPDHEANGGEDCVAVWTITGTVGDPADPCATCDYSLDLAGDIDFGASTCPDDLLYPRSFSTTYYVREDPPGISTVYFPSGNELGTGCIDGTRVTYASEGWCEEML